VCQAKSPKKSLTSFLHFRYSRNRFRQSSK
jgi:hypothetical protein